jgi:hypothetical protein
MHYITVTFTLNLVNQYEFQSQEQRSDLLNLFIKYLIKSSIHDLIIKALYFKCLSNDIQHKCMSAYHSHIVWFSLLDQQFHINISWLSELVVIQLYVLVVYDILCNWWLSMGWAQWLINPCIHRIWKSLTFYCMTLNQFWVNIKQRRLCSLDTPIFSTFAIINLIVYRK